MQHLISISRYTIDNNIQLLQSKKIKNSKILRKSKKTILFYINIEKHTKMLYNCNIMYFIKNGFYKTTIRKSRLNGKKITIKLRKNLLLTNKTKVVKYRLNNNRK